MAEIEGVTKVVADVPAQSVAIDPLAHSGTVTTEAGKQVATPTTTEEENRHSAGQREINRTWEDTQRQIALGVTAVSLLIAAWLAVMGATESVQTAALVFVFGVANLVIGFYFGRTNHQRTGGIGGDSAGHR